MMSGINLDNCQLSFRRAKEFVPDVMVLLRSGKTLVTERLINGIIQPIPTKTVVLHKKPDLDGMASYWLAYQFPLVFPGIREAPIVFWSQGPPPDGRTAAEHEAEGTVCFDVGEGRFDHHPHGAPGKDLTKCGVDLVADYLGLSDDVTLSQILGYIRMHDLEGPIALTLDLRGLGVPEEIIDKAGYQEAFSFYSMIDSLRRRHHGKEESLIREVCILLDDHYERQVHFWEVVSAEFYDQALIYRIVTKSRTYKVAVIESEERRVGSFSRTRQGGFCAVCIHRQPGTGHVFISGHLSSEQYLQIGDVWRIWEMQKRGITTEYQLRDLEVSKFPLCPNVYLPQNRRGEFFITMNGGEKATDVEPTLLNLEELTAAVHIAIDDDILSPQCPKTACLYNACNYYPFGLTRCRKIREPQS